MEKRFKHRFKRAEGDAGRRITRSSTATKHLGETPHARQGEGNIFVSAGLGEQENEVTLTQLLKWRLNIRCGKHHLRGKKEGSEKRFLHTQHYTSPAAGGQANF